MNEQNFQYLKDNLKYMGFGENMTDMLEAGLKQEKPEFSLSYETELNRKPFQATLNFRKSDNSDMYFFNSYQASLTRANGKKLDQTFYVNKGKGITAKEAYNLLEGRAVFKELTTKEGQPYKAWVQLDFDKKDKHNNYEVKQFHENYGFDLKAAVVKFPIAELADAEKEKALLQSLQKGNVQAVSIEKDGGVAKMFLEANPQFKTVTLYDAQMKRVQKEEISQFLSERPGQGNEVKEAIKGEKQSKEQKNEALLPKKRNGKKNGLGIS